VVLPEIKRKSEELKKVPGAPEELVKQRDS